MSVSCVQPCPQDTTPFPLNTFPTCFVSVGGPSTVQCIKAVQACSSTRRDKAKVADAALFTHQLQDQPRVLSAGKTMRHPCRR